MDAQTKRKALFRAKVKAQKLEKQRIDSPLIRYDEHDQPVCRVCGIIIKSESLWSAHQASRKHHEAVDKLKASAAILNQVNNYKAGPHLESQKSKLESQGELHDKYKPSTALPKTRPSMPPPDFFDAHESKRQRNGKDMGQLRDLMSLEEESVSKKTQVVEPFSSGTDRSAAERAESSDEDFKQVSSKVVCVEDKQVKGALPEGFFDDKDSDLRARGITPVKLDVKDEYKEFEKLIQEDLQEIDARLEEEEFDAAEMIEEAESVEQRSYRERVDTLRRKKLELKASRSSVLTKDIKILSEDSSHSDSYSDDENDENIMVDWRAKHL